MMAVINFKGQLIDETTVDFLMDNDPRSLDRLCDVIQNFIRARKIARDKVLAVGVNISGRVNSQTGYSYSYFFVEEQPLTVLLGERLDPAGFEALRPLLTDPDPLVRSAATVPNPDARRARQGETAVDVARVAAEAGALDGLFNCAGVVHGDLSEFNILLAHLPGVDGAEDADGPVIIDLPQAVDAAGNNHAQRMLLRDVANLRDFFGQFAPELRSTQYGPEIWSLYQSGLLSNETPLTGRYAPDHVDVDMQAVLREIDDARDEDAARRLRMATAA